MDQQIGAYYRRLGVSIALFMALMYSWMEFAAVRFGTCDVWNAPRLGIMLGAGLLLLIIIRPGFMDHHFRDILHAIPWVAYTKPKPNEADDPEPPAPRAPSDS